MKKERYAVTGMTCSACSAHVQKAVAAVPGVHSVQVNLLQNNMTVEFEEAETTPETIFAAVKKAGYGAVDTAFLSGFIPPAVLEIHIGILCALLLFQQWV